MRVGIVGPGRLGRSLSALLARAIALADARAERVIVVSIPDWGVTGFAHAQQRDAHRVATEIDAFNATAQAIPGTGLGLAFTREVIQIHGGHIAATSELGKGSRFTVSLPIWT